MARDAEMTAGTACGERQVPGPRGAASLPLCHSRDPEPGGLCQTRPACASSLPAWKSSFRNAWNRAGVSLSSFGHGADSSARVLGRERNWGAGKRPRSGSGMTRADCTGALQCEWPGCRGMWDLSPGQARLVASPATLALPSLHALLFPIPAVPGSARSQSQAPAASCCCPALLLTSNPTCFQKLFNF